MFSLLTSFLMFFLHNNPAQVSATAQQNSTDAATANTLHTNVKAAIPIGDGSANGTTVP